MALTKTPMEKTSNGMKFIGRQLLLRLIFAGTVHRSQGVTLQRAVIDCRMKFWERGQLDVILSGIKSPGDLCIWFPDNRDDFTIHPPVDLNVVQIFETKQSSRPRAIPQISPGDNVESGIASIDSFDATLSDELPCATTTSTLPRIKFILFPVSIMMLLKKLVRTRLRHLSMFRPSHESLRINRRFDLIASEISSLKSLSPDLLCLLRHFSVGYFEPATQNSYWYRTNDYHPGWNDHPWILYSKPGYYSLNSSWLIVFIVNTIFVNHHILIRWMR
jgi:hypothetical protein